MLTGRPVHSVGLQVGLASGGHLHMTHLAAPEPGIVGRWTLVGETWQARLAGGYVPALGGWRMGPTDVFENGHWHTLTLRVAPLPDQREPWSEAHVAVAQAFLGVIPCLETLAAAEDLHIHEGVDPGRPHRGGRSRPGDHHRGDRGGTAGV